ncbi:hypothetical protein H0H92_010616, partial [Tricholoma furcatifolium]
LAQSDLSDLLETVVGDIAAHFPDVHVPLVALLNALKPQSERFELDLVYVLEERWFEYGDPDFSCSLQQDARDEWTNINRFAALMHNANVQDLSSFAVDTLAMAWRRKEWPMSDDLIALNVSNDLVALNGHAPAASQWILVCGDRLYKECSEAKEKWAQWEADIDWIVQHNDLSDSIKSLCQKTLDEMRKVSILET